MKQVVMLKGANGIRRLKYAQELMISEPEVWTRISAKDILSMLSGHVSPASGKYVMKLRNLLITAAMADGYNIVVDDPHLFFSSEVNLREIVDIRNKIEEYNGTGVSYKFYVQEV